MKILSQAVPIIIGCIALSTSVLASTTENIARPSNVVRYPCRVHHEAGVKKHFCLSAEPTKKTQSIGEVSSSVATSSSGILVPLNLQNENCQINFDNSAQLLLLWSCLADSKVICLVKESDSLEYSSEIEFCLRAGQQKLQAFESTLPFVGAFIPDADQAGDLVTIWGGGSGQHFIVFRFFESEGVRIVAQFGAYTFPELVDLNDDGNIDFIYTTEKFDPERAHVLIYDEKDGYVASIVRWHDRYKSRGKKKDRSNKSH